MKVNIKELSFIKLDKAIDQAIDQAIYNDEKIHYLIMNQETFEGYYEMSQKLPFSEAKMIPKYSYSNSVFIYHGYPIAVYNGLKYGEVDII